ncbi:PKD domain-containing protein [bacterium AH-315-M05]|nr:PKD domain-containing protein [bacterium AH-315-M05]
MKKSILLLSFICLLIVQGLCQREGNNWYFGNYAGLNFSTNPPNILTDGHLTTGEGCASVSTRSGILLFYTDGTYVWDANHIIMPNGTGLFGNPSSTQSAVICPKPSTYNYALERFDAYYIITIDVCCGGTNGVRFSEVDMTLNGGTGDVLVANKNTLLFGTATIEGANIARHANGCDYWIIGKEVGTTNIRTYLVTSVGVSNIPVVSVAISTGVSHVGSIKVSPNNNLVSIVNNTTPSVEVYDFDNSTGVLTSKFYDNMPWVSGYRAYSSEFSPDNKVFYATTLNNPNVYQYDLTALNNAAFQASRTIIGTTANTIGYRMCGIQMALNGKIYAALQGLNYLGVINNPNILGVGCNYVDNGQSIAGVNTFSGTNIIGTLGLPAFPSFFIKEPIEIISQNLCYDDQTIFQISDTAEVNLIEWTITDTNLVPITQSTNFELTFQFTNSGQYIVSAIVHYPCFIDSSLIDTITITYVNPINFGNDTSFCQGQSVTLDAGTGYDYYLWHNGDTSQTFLADTTGQYIVQVMIQSEDSICIKTDTINITVFPIPIAAFSFTSECFGTPTNFTDLSNSNGGTITNWNWDFDNDGIVDNTTQNPSFTFSSAGTFSVNLNVSTAGGLCPHDTTINIVVNPIPTANFTFTNVCLNDATAFNDTSLISSGSVVAWQWDFGDGAGTSTLQYPTYIFNTPDTFIVTLSVTSDSGCTSIVGYPVVVYPLPVANFTTANVCLYDDAVFTDVSTISSGSVTSWQWDFGDGNTATTQNTTHLYSADSTYNVTLIVASNNNCLDTLVQSIEIYPIPVAGFSTNNVCLYDLAVFTDASTISSGSIISFNWDFGDGTSTTQNPTHLYSTDGTYYVSLLVTTNNSCVDTVVDTLIIYPVPAANFITGPVCLYDAAVFTDVTIINSPDGVVSWQWDFGDGTGTSVIQNPSYNYASAGPYNVQLIVTSNNSCIDDTLLTVEIYPIPDVQFTYDIASGCEPLYVNFTDLTTITPGTINFRDWDFGDGNSSTLQNPENCYTAINVNTTRIATVTLIATSLDGCVDTSTIINMITIWPNPIAVFIAEPQPTTILNPVINFIDQSQGDTIAWSWDFGDPASGETDFIQNPVHEYSDTGTYIVEQIIVNQFSCPDTFYRTIIIQPGYIFHVPSAFTPNDDGINETFIPQGIGIDEENFEMIIYDRWGNLIYETTNINKPWDGRANNGSKIAQQDVYIWVIFTRDMQGGRHKYLGHVTLVR